MPPEFDPQLENLIHEELRKLPPLRAPRTLAPRVLAAIHARVAAHWWQRSWWQWPLAIQLGFAVLVVGIVAAFTGGGWFVGNEISGYFQAAAQRFAPLADCLSPLGNAGLLVWNKYFQPIALYGLVALALMYLSALGAGTMFVRIAVKRS